MKLWQLAASVMFAFASVSTAHGEDILEVDLPTRTIPKVTPYSTQNGLRLFFGSIAAKSAGYRPIKFQLFAKKAKPVDRQVTVRLSLRSWSQNNQKTITVEKSAELAAGATKTIFYLRLLQPGNWDFCGVEVFVDGRLDEELSREYITTSTSTNPTGAVPELQVLGLAREATPGAGSRLLSVMWNRFLQGNQPSTTDIYPPNELAGLTVEFFLQNWQSNQLDYSTYDVVDITKANLQLEAQKSPDKLQTLLRWVATGGTLWIMGDGESPEELAALFDSLPQVKAWQATVLVPSRAPDNRIPDWEVGKPKQSDSMLADESTSSPADSGDWYLRKRLGFGEIYVFRSKWNQLPGGAQRRLSGSMEGITNDTVAHWRSRAWAPRHGLQPDAANSEYSTFLIPGVGLAPVVEFQFLITLFVLVIGPLNYLLLRAYDRLHLMVLTTPLCALVASVGLFGYAVIADGFGAKARLRSVTLLDQASGEMANLGRVSLYAGITPSTGLSVPADTAIYPILPGWNEYSANEVRQPPKELVWTDTEQRLTEGWIPSRTTAQYYTLRANQTARKLRMVAAPDKVRVTNELGAAIEWLFVVDEANETWIGPKLAVDASAQLKPIAKLDAVGQFRELCLAADPQFPAGYDSNMSVNNPQNRRALRRPTRGTWQPLDYSNIAAGNSLMEQYLDELSGLTGAEALNLPPRSYVTITSQPTEQPVPLKDAEQLSGFHVTVGRW
jgi:hypothetical protein